MRNTVRKSIRTLVITVFGLVSGGVALATPLADAVEADYPYLNNLFRYFHANPELSMLESKTSDRLAVEMF